MKNILFTVALVASLTVVALVFFDAFVDRDLVWASDQFLKLGLASNLQSPPSAQVNDLLEWEDTKISDASQGKKWIASKFRRFQSVPDR